MCIRDRTTDFPQAMAFGATRNVEFARQSGRVTAQEARAIGVQWNWFPDADVNSNPANPIINTRSFGEDPKLVSDMAAAYIAGAHEYGCLLYTSDAADEEDSVDLGGRRV